MTENEHMEEMLEAFHDIDEDHDGGHNVVGSMDTTEFLGSKADKEHQNMRKLARLPLYNGAKIYVLRASLAMKFIFVNSEPMQKWLERYELAKEANALERAQF